MNETTERLVNAFGELVTNNPYVNSGLWTATGEPSTLTVTGPDGDEHRVPTHAHDLEAVATAVRAGREEFDRSQPGHPRAGQCAFCDPDTGPSPQARNPIAGLIDALGELVTNYPMGEGPTTRVALTDTDGATHSVSLDPGQVDHVADLVETARKQVENAYYQDPECARCEAEIRDEETPVII